MNIWKKLANERSCTVAELGISADNLAMLAAMSQYKVITSSSVPLIAEKMLDGSDPLQIALDLDLILKDDSAEIEKAVEKVWQENPQAVADLAGKKKERSVNFLIGKVMKETGGKADASKIRDIITKKAGP